MVKEIPAELGLAVNPADIKWNPVYRFKFLIPQSLDRGAAEGDFTAAEKIHIVGYQGDGFRAVACEEHGHPAFR